MTKTHRTSEDRRLRRKTAAFRLKHDVGKAVRWSAPEGRESDETALRARLLADLFPRTSGGTPSRDVLQIFFEWKKEEGSLFDPGDADLDAIARAMERIAAGRDQLLAGAGAPPAAAPSPSPPSQESLSSSSRSLSYSSLVALDEACLEASRACTAFYRRIAIEEGPEIVRPPGASGIHRRRGGGGA